MHVIIKQSPTNMFNFFIFTNNFYPLQYKLLNICSCNLIKGFQGFH